MEKNFVGFSCIWGYVINYCSKDELMMLWMYLVWDYGMLLK